MLSNEDLDFINEFERTRLDQSKINEGNINAVLEALKPLVAHNLNYLKYAKIKGFFEISEEQEEREARHNALTTILGRAISWSVGEGRELAFKLLEETNDHKTAEAVKPLLLGYVYYTYSLPFDTLTNAEKWIEENRIIQKGQKVTIHKTTRTEPSKWIKTYEYVKGEGAS